MNNPPPVRLVAGLGNPGPQYAASRHNLGFMVVEAFADYWGLSLNQKKFNTLWGEIRRPGKKVLLALPQTYMNLSGQAVKSLADYFAFEPESIVVVHDDLDLEFGRFKISINRGAGGHKGISSIMDYLDTGEFVRLRMGIGRPRFNEPVERYVLANFYADQQAALAGLVEDGQACLRAMLEDGVTAAMQKFNRT